MIDYLHVDDLLLPGVESFTMGSPAPRAVVDARPTDHGATDATLYYGPRSFELIGSVTAASFADLWAAIDNIKGKLVLGSVHVIRFRRTGLAFDEQAVVRVDSPVDIPLTPMPSPYLNFGVSLFAADPRIYTSTQVQGTYDPSSSGTGGLFFPLTFPLNFNVSDTAGRLTVDHEGNIATPPVFVITGPVTNPILDLDTLSRSIYTRDTTLAAGDILTIDVAARSVVLNGTTSRPDLINTALTDWFYIAPGSNQLRLRGSGMVAAQTQLAVSFRHARI